MGSQENPPPNVLTPAESSRATDEMGAANQVNDKLKLIHNNFATLWKNRSDNNAALKYLSGLGVNMEGISIKPPDMTTWNEKSKNYYRAANIIRNELAALTGAGGGLTHEQAESVMTNLIKQDDTPEDYKNILKNIDNNILTTVKTPVLMNRNLITRPKISE